EKEKSEALKRKVSSGNVVPAVGMREGAKPLHIQGLAITKHKIFIQFPKVNPIYFIFRPAINFSQTWLVLSLLLPPTAFGCKPTCQWQAVHFVSRAYNVLLKPLIKLLAPLGKTLGIVPLQSNS
ncbi:MAG: hypothetical protein SPL45_03715, partial [Schwartzia succinivorans]|nr:hypothetical protein [Schwartzia succinivorans]